MLSTDAVGAWPAGEVPLVRFELIDRVLECQAGRLVAVKNVTAAEEYLADHFPGFPVLPGVMMLEALVQAGRRLVEANAKPAADAGAKPQAEMDAKPQSEAGAKSHTAPARPLVLAEVRNLRYGNMVRPGQCLRVEVTLKPGGNAEQGWEITGLGSVDGQAAVQGKFRLQPLQA